MALFDDIVSGGDLLTGVALCVGAAIILPLAGPILRPLAKNVIKGGILAYQGAAGLIENISDLAAEAAAETGREITPRHSDGRHTPQSGRRRAAVEIRSSRD
jgi:uncharacterized membrane protein